jgi:hypothetical protein
VGALWVVDLELGQLAPQAVCEDVEWTEEFYLFHINKWLCIGCGWEPRKAGKVDLRKIRFWS